MRELSEIYSILGIWAKYFTCPISVQVQFLQINHIEIPQHGLSYCSDTVYKVNFKFSLSSIFYIEEMLTIICNSSNGLYFVYLFAVDHSFHCNLDLETCPDLETCLELVLLPNYIDLSYKQ